MQLSFFPVGGFAKGNGSVTCPSSGNDAHCSGDKFESCLLHIACGGVKCEPKDQLNLANFLKCFEADHDSAPEHAAACASAAGFDVAAINACASDPTSANAAFDAVQSAAKEGMVGATCFPWIVVDGVVKSTDPEEGCFGKDAGTAPLLPLLCAAIKSSGGDLPAGCA